jgi:hypothetical protein
VADVELAPGNVFPLLGDHRIALQGMVVQVVAEAAATEP